MSDVSGPLIHRVEEFAKLPLGLKKLKEFIEKHADQMLDVMVAFQKLSDDATASAANETLDESQRNATDTKANALAVFNASEVEIFKRHVDDLKVSLESS